VTALSKRENGAAATQLQPIGSKKEYRLIVPGFSRKKKNPEMQKIQIFEVKSHNFNNVNISN